MIPRKQEVFQSSNKNSILKRKINNQIQIKIPRIIKQILYFKYKNLRTNKNYNYVKHDVNLFKIIVIKTLKIPIR